MYWLLKIVIATAIVGIGICILAAHFMATITQQIN